MQRAMPRVWCAGQPIATASRQFPRPVRRQHPATRRNLATIPRPDLRLSEQRDQQVSAQMQSSAIINCQAGTVALTVLRVGDLAAPFAGVTLGEAPDNLQSAARIAVHVLG